MPTPSTVQSHPQLAEIQLAIQAHAENGRPSFRDIERQFGLSHGVPARYAAEYMNVAPGKSAKRIRRTAKRALAKIVDVRPVALDTPDDVLQELRYLYAETRSLYKLAKKSSDTRLMDKALSGGAALLDRFAKSFGMFTDGGNTFVNINGGRAAATFDSMPEDELVAFITSASRMAPKALPATIEVALGEVSDAA